MSDEQDDRIPEDRIDQLILDMEDGIRHCTVLARRKNSGPKAFLIVCVSNSSSMIEEMGRSGVVVSAYDRLQMMLMAMGHDETANLLVPPSCGHYGVFLTSGSMVKFGCSECDFGIVVEKAS